mmetsp:Transcript_48038/g.134107  ORF Transcript_48038/g.134107 Transcript_48038/m.134107 type:complete len:243 (+) Transcript_48038:80-808(+)
MGSTQTKQNQKGPNNAFSPKELYNLKQVYFYLCLHTTTLTSCPLDRNQFHSLFGCHRQYKPLWRALFNAIDRNEDNVIDFEEFLTFVTDLKRGDAEARRHLCFRLFDPNRDNYAERGDFRGIAEAKAASFRRPSWQQQQAEDESEDEYAQFFNACDDDGDGRFNFEDFENYCLSHGDAVANQILKLLEVMFDGVIEETGIIITATDVKNTKPHIDWQDHKIAMGSLFCCSSQPPIFTTPPAA